MKNKSQNPLAQEVELQKTAETLPEEAETRTTAEEKVPLTLLGWLI